MDNDFFIDEGYYMDIDDIIQYVKWKTAELINLGYSKKDVLFFYDNYEWKRIVRLLIK